MLNETKQPGETGEWTSEPDDLLDIAVGHPPKDADSKSAATENHPRGTQANGLLLPSSLSRATAPSDKAAHSAEEATTEASAEDAPALEVPLMDRTAVEFGPAEKKIGDSSFGAEEVGAEESTLWMAASQPAGTAILAHTDASPFAQEYEAAQPPLADEPPQENWFALLLKETLETVVLAVVIFLLIRVAIQNYRIEGSSMEPNFHNGEYLLVNKLAYRLGEYQRGDVIVFKYPGDTTKDYIKRVIGLPGDTVEIRDGALFVNDQLVAEPYQVMPMNYLNELPKVVEPGTLYVMGDNRPASSDTRDWGLLDQDLVIGQAWLAIYPFDTFGLVDHPDLHFTPGMAQGP